MAPLVLPPFFLQLWTEIAIVGLFATAFNLLMGFGGMVSFGHAAYFALGAYTAALLVKRARRAAAAGAAGGADRRCGGRPAVRLLHRAAQPHVLRHALAGLRPDRLHRDLQVEDAHRRRRRPASDVWPPSLLKSPAAYYYFTLAIVGLCMLALHAIVASPFGYALKAVRENPRRARYIGIDVRRHQLAAFVISGAFSGVAGGLFAFYNGSVFPDFAYFTKSFEPLVVALLGGDAVVLRPAGRRLRLQDPRVADQPPVARVLAALPRRRSSSW